MLNETTPIWNYSVQLLNYQINHPFCYVIELQYNTNFLNSVSHSIFIFYNVMNDFGYNLWLLVI